MSGELLTRLPGKHKRWLRGLHSSARLLWVSTFRSYGADRLMDALRSLGVHEGGTVLLHSGFSPYNGFDGAVGDATDVFQRAVGPEGNLLMVSLPYRSSTRAYLETLTRFDVRRTPSLMGVMSEFFRRRPGVLRSLHPTHPVLALGPRARWIVADHESCEYGCGPGSPFEKLLELDAKVLFFDVPFPNFTFFHYLEHRVRERLPFPLYHERRFEVSVVDHEGRARSVATYAFSDEAIGRRRVPALQAELERRGRLARRRVGNTTILAVGVRSAVRCADEMVREGRFFHDLAGT